MSAIHEQQPEFARHFANSLFKVIDHADHQATELLQRATQPSSKTPASHSDNNNKSALATVCQLDADVAANHMSLHALTAVIHALPPASDLLAFGETSITTLTAQLDALETHLQLHHNLPPVPVFEALATTPPATPLLAPPQQCRSFAATTASTPTAATATPLTTMMSALNTSEMRTPSPEPVPPPPPHQVDPLAAFPKTPRMEDFGLDDSSLQDLRNETHNLSFIHQTPVPSHHFPASYTPITTSRSRMSPLPELPNRTLVYDEDNDHHRGDHHH